ncbi:MAG: dihydroorotase [Hyphomicrobiales bacterium]|nr:dihydroorotase [Hyphomicrobiales bacterium]
MIASSTVKRDNRPKKLVNARLFCPKSGLDEPGGLRVEEGRIADAGPHIRPSPGADELEMIDCGGHLLIPGLIDMQVSTGEPGEEHRETLATASRAAAAGGVTTIICMPNTKPAIDDVSLVDFIERRARDTAIVNVHTMAAMTKGLAGKEMTEIGLLREAGALAFTDATHTVGNAQLMRNILSYTKDFDALVVHFAEDRDLAASGVMNEGEVSTGLGLHGTCTEAETIIVERDIRLTELTGGHYHAANISCAQSLHAIEAARARKLHVTCGVTINHLTLNENDIGSYRTYYKMRPPLRAESDRQAMVEGLRQGNVDVIVSAHDPQDVDDKRRPFAEAADGALGVETLLPAALQLYHNGNIELRPLLRAMTCRPAELLGLPGGSLEIGGPADLAVVDLDKPWRVDAPMLASKSKNSPFDERVLQGRAIKSFVGGTCVYTLSQSRH